MGVAEQAEILQTTAGFYFQGRQASKFSVHFCKPRLFVCGRSAVKEASTSSGPVIRYLNVVFPSGAFETWKTQFNHCNVPSLDASVDYYYDAEWFAEMNRKRVFLLCAKQSFAKRLFKEIQLLLNICCRFSFKCSCPWFNILSALLISSQDLPQYVKPGVWNPGNEVPKVHWLKARPEARDQARLHALGNIVIPQQAKMAMSCFQSLMERAHECQANN